MRLAMRFAISAGIWAALSLGLIVWSTHPVKAVVITGGPVVLMGIDTEDGGHPLPADYTSLINSMLSKVPALPLRSGILVVGAGKPTCSDSPDASKVFWDTVDTNITTDTVTYVNGGAISTQIFSGFKMIAVASSDTEIFSGCGLTQSENDSLAARQADIKSFVNGGGALLGFTQTGLTNPYAYITGLGSFTITTGRNYNNIAPTPDGTALGITDAAFDKCCWHDEFVAFPSFLKVLATNAGNTSGLPNSGTVGNAAAIGGSEVVIIEEICGDGIDNDGVGGIDDGCTQTRTASVGCGADGTCGTADDNDTATFDFPGDHFLKLSCTEGVAADATFTVQEIRRRPEFMTGRFDETVFGTGTTCIPSDDGDCREYVLEGPPDGCVNPDVETSYEWWIRFTGKNFANPNMGYSSGSCDADTIYNQKILDRLHVRPGDPDGIGYSDSLSCVVMTTTPDASCLTTPNSACAEICGDAIDNNDNGVVNEGCAEVCTDRLDNDRDLFVNAGGGAVCSQTEPVSYSPGTNVVDSADFTELTFGTNLLQLTFEQVNNAFSGTFTATLMTPEECEARIDQTAFPTDVCQRIKMPDGSLGPAVLYEINLTTGAGTPQLGTDYANTGATTGDAIEFLIRYLTPFAALQNQEPGMLKGTCDPEGLFKDILQRFLVDPNDPDGIGYSDSLSCLAMTQRPLTEEDTTAPTLTLPDDVTVQATGPDGAIVFYDATATDPGTEVEPIPSCDPPSGSLFPLSPIGVTIVTCTATDLSGNTTTGTFKVTVVNTAPAGLTLNTGSINENGSFTLIGSFTDPDTTQAHTVVINWGEGPSTTLILAPEITSFSASHQYLDDNPTGTPSDSYPIHVIVTDVAGTSTTGDTSVTVNNVAPVITGVTGPVGPLALGSVATVSATFTDVGTQDTHTCTFAWDDGSPSTVVTGSSGGCSATHTYVAAGVYTVGVTVTDDDTGSATSTFEFVVIFDPSAGFVTGGGWINSPAGAYTPDSTLTGKANFGFVSKYQKGVSVPTGQTQFQLQVANFNFHSSVYEVLVVSGHKAQYKGSGTVNGGGDYGFRLTAYDGQVSGGGGLDKFRVKIWDKATNVVIYDNRLGSSDDIDTADPQVIGGGSIVIHSGK